MNPERFKHSQLANLNAPRNRHKDAVTAYDVACMAIGCLVGLALTWGFFVAVLSLR